MNSTRIIPEVNLPEIDIHPGATEWEYFAAAGADRLTFQQCAHCHEVRYPPAVGCPHCRSQAATWVESHGRGRVYSCLVVRHSVSPRLPAPYAIGLVELDDMVGADPSRTMRVLSNILTPNGENTVDVPVPEGTPVEVVFAKFGPGLGLPYFRLVNS